MVIPAYNEAGNIVQVSGPCRPRSRAFLHAIVVDDGSSDDTMSAPGPRERPQCIFPNRGQEPPLHRLPAGARDGRAPGRDDGRDGQHQPSELPGLIQPILDDKVDVVNGSRVLGAADPNHAARKLGIKVFAWALSLLTASRATDPACGYRAVRTEALRDLEFHRTSSTTPSSSSRRRSESSGRGGPVTVSSRLSGASKKPPHFRYGLGFANALLRAWLR